MADKRISQLIERVDIANNDVLPIVASGATTTNKVTISTLQTWMQGNLDVGVTSVGLTMPSAFSVAGSPVTSSGNITVTAAGTASQYIRGDGTLADFPTGGGGGASISYYLNGSVSQGTIGGVAYLEMNKTPILGAGTDFNIAADGYIASFVTDAGDPSLLEIPGGNWNFESYFSASSGGGSPTFYVELYKVSGSTATLIASNSSSPELIAFGTTINAYFSSLAVPQTVLTLTDRLAIRYYVNHSGRTITLHTEDNHLCQIITTFTTGLTALNGLTAQVQNFAVGTSGTDFNISSAGSIHTFNIPTANSTNRGALSSADWGLFNSAYNDKINSAAVTGTTTKTLTLTQQDGGTITASWSDLNTDSVTSVFGRTGAVVAVSGDYTTAQVTESGNLYFTQGRVSANTDVAANTAARHNSVTLGTANGLSLSTQVLSLGLASSGVTGALSGTDWTTFNNKQNALGFTPVPESRTITINGTTQDLSANRTFNISTIASVTASSPLASSGGNNPNISIQQSSGSQSGFLSSTDWNTFNNKENAITAGTTAQYFRGDKTFQTLNTAAVTESGNLYYTDARSRSALSFAAGSGAYNTSTGVITIPTNNNQITNGAGYITSSSLSGYLPLTGGTLTGALSGTSASFSSFGDGLGFRANGSSAFGGTGVGLETGWSGSLGYVQAYNRSTSTYQPIKVDGSTVSLQISGTPALSIASTGSVGIGNPTPSGALQVSNAGYAIFNNSAHTQTPLSTGLSIGYNRSGANGETSLVWGAPSSGFNFEIASVTGGTITPRLTITSTGAATFSSSVTANGTATFLAQFGNGNNVNEKVIQFLRASASTDIVNIQGINAGVGASNIAMQVLGGNVGIGTPTPDRRLTINSGASEGGLGLTSNNGVEIDMVGYGTGFSHPQARIKMDDAGFYGGNLSFWTKPNGAQTNLLSERMRITSGGNVGIGTPSPAEKLHVLTSTNYAATFNSSIGDLTTTRISLGGFTTSGGGLGGSAAIGCEHHHFATASSALTFYTFGSGSLSERMRITSDGYVRLTSNSGGIQFNGDTAAANALDDYEEGTWTMGISFGGASVGTTYNDNTGTYTKIGRQVTANGWLNIALKGSSVGAARITGLPFVTAGSSVNYSSVSFRATAITYVGMIQGFPLPSSTTIELEEIGETGTVTVLRDTDFSNGSTIMMSITYFI